MVFKKKISILLTFLFLVAWFAPFAQAQEEGTVIHSITIQGNKRIDTSTIRFYIKSEEGKPLDRQQIRHDIEQIYGLGQFKDVKVDTQPAAGGGVDLVYLVAEIPAVGQIRVVGNDKVITKDILDKITIKRGSAFSDNMVQSSIDEVVKVYRDKGFFFVNVKIDTEASKENVVDVNIRVIEGKKVSVEKIRFTGNKTFADKDLRDVMEVREKTWLAFFDESGIYKKDLLKLDMLRVEGFYHDHGFLKVRVLEPAIEVNKKDKEIYITIPIEEGDQYKVTSVTFEGDTALTEEEIGKAVKTKAGVIYNEGQLREDVLSLTEHYSKTGFAYADINPQTKIDEKTKTVELKFEIDKGKKVYIGEITVLGNTRTRDNVVRREFRMKEGDLFDSDKLKRTKQRLTNLGYFSDVKIDTKRGKDAETINLETSVAEKPTGAVTVGAGYSSIEKVLFNGSISQDNLFGTGRRLVFSTALSAIRTNYNIDFSDPRINDSDISGGANLFKNQSYFYTFQSDSAGAGVRVGKNLTEYDWFGISYRFDDVRISNVDAAVANAFLQNGTRVASRIGPTFVHDTRDDFMNPTSGWRHTVSFEYAGGPLGGADFYKSSYEAIYYHPLIGKLVGALRGQIQYANGYGGQLLPIFEHYFMGGPSSLRGYTIQNVGPQTTTGLPLGGNESLLLNAEVQYPFNQSFRGYVFYDRGNIYGTGDVLYRTAQSFDLSQMRHSIGAGIRFISPFGPIGFAYGFKLDKQPGEKIGEFHFSAGSAF